MNKRPLTACAVLLMCGIWAASVRAWYAYLTAAAVLLVNFLSFFCAPSSGPRQTRTGTGRSYSGGPEHSFQHHLFLQNFLFRLNRAWFMGPVFVFFLLCGFLLYLQADENSRWYEVCDLDDRTVTLTGTVYAAESDDDSQSLFLKNVTLTADGMTYAANRVLVRTYTDEEGEGMPLYDEIRIGNVIQVEGEVSYFSEARNPGNFNAREYYRIQRVDFCITPSGISIADAKTSVYADLLSRLKNRFRSIFRTCLSEETYGVLCTMVLGDDSGLSEEMEELYQEAGISHILAISGLHVSVMGMLLYRRMRRHGFSYLICSVPSAFLVISFGIMSGMGIAVRRAMIMFAVMLIGNLFGYAYDSLSALALAAIIILVSNPLLLFSASFQLSFAAVLGVSALFPILKSFLRIRNGAAENFLLSLSIQLLTIPVTLYYYYEIPVFSLAANFIAVPFVSVLLIDGIAGGFCGLISIPPAKAVLLPDALILEGYTFLCRCIQKIPGHMLICGRPSWVRIILYYGILAAAALLMKRIAEGKTQVPENETRKKTARSAGRLSRRAASAGAAAAVALALLLCMVLRIPTAFRITMLDVGQGDGILIESGGVNLFIDGGSSNVTDVGTRRIEPFLKYSGIGSIDLWLVSHADSDHISGLENLLENGYRINTLAFAAGVYRDETLSELIYLAEENSTQILYLTQGSTLTQADAVWTVIYPEDENRYTDKNEASMVLFLQYGDFTALFTGDMTEDTEADLLEDGALRKYLGSQIIGNGIDLLKVAHHGSKYSSSEAFLEAVSPSAALISAGVDNIYGHPSEETLIRLREYTDEIFVTSEAGAITVTVDNGGMSVKTFLE